MARNIISASRRTDIPAFYAEWFLNRLRAGYCTVANPYRPSQVRRVSLLPEHITGYVFWTRHAGPFTPVLDTIDEMEIPYYFLYTLLGYPRQLEPAAPARGAGIRDILALADRLGPQRVIWRYDPLILSSDITHGWHRSNFGSLADALRGRIEHVILSVVDPYRKTLARNGDADGRVQYAPADYGHLLEDIAGIAASAGMNVQSCAEPELRVPGIDPGACVDARQLGHICGKELAGSPHGLREGCLCDRSVDIGANNTCGFGCRYCYATANHAKAKYRLQEQNPEWNALTGDLGNAESD